MKTKRYNLDPDTRFVLSIPGGPDRLLIGLSPEGVPFIDMENQQSLAGLAAVGKLEIRGMVPAFLQTR